MCIRDSRHSPCAFYAGIAVYRNAGKNQARALFGKRKVISEIFRHLSGLQLSLPNIWSVSYTHLDVYKRQTYHYQEIWDGLQACYADLTKDVERLYGVPLTKIGAMGVSAMMHGYMPFDENGELLVPFRTWRNTITGQAAAALTDLFAFNIPQRWSCLLYTSRCV